MKKLKDYKGKIRFSDASICISAEPDLPRGFSFERNEWEKNYKRDVFSRVIQQLNRLGWVCVIPEEMVERYGAGFARSYRKCQKGDLHGELEITCTHIEFKMWQNINVPQSEREDGNGKYLFNKEKHMPYLLLLEMKRTRNRIKKYVENVCSFTFDEPWVRGRNRPKAGGLTAIEYIEMGYRNSWHFDEKLGHNSGIECTGNSTSADKKQLRHKMPVWFYDQKGRLNKGTAYYNSNNMWWVVTGKYDFRNIYCGALYIDIPNSARFKNNQNQRTAALIKQESEAVANKDYERAIIFRNLLSQGVEVAA
ncbi:hypothetical protein [Acinetobacter rudis]|uniref:hypothetical protein n=1 Tax=Acinetobacter rudis TaxID=632955 RepID=UPI00334068BB